MTASTAEQAPWPDVGEFFAHTCGGRKLEETAAAELNTIPTEASSFDKTNTQASGCRQTNEGDFRQSPASTTTTMYSEQENSIYENPSHGHRAGYRPNNPFGRLLGASRFSSHGEISETATYNNQEKSAGCNVDVLKDLVSAAVSCRPKDLKEDFPSVATNHNHNTQITLTDQSSLRQPQDSLRVNNSITTGDSNDVLNKQADSSGDAVEGLEIGVEVGGMYSGPGEGAADVKPERHRKGDHDLVDHGLKGHQKHLSIQEESRNVSHEDIEVTNKHEVQIHLPPTDHPSSRGKKDKLSPSAPVQTIEVKAKEADNLVRSISELTMRSSYAARENNALVKITDNRRMAYYAVGKKFSGRGGNRRCYFSGKLILGGSPFYAGAVQQGLRTLVVFCLPSAIGLPRNKGSIIMKLGRGSNGAHPNSVTRALLSISTLPRTGGKSTSGRSVSGRSMNSLAHTHASTVLASLEERSGRLPRSKRGGASVVSKSGSKFSSLDDLSLSVDGDLDPNWSLDRDYLMKVLPPVNADFLKKVAATFPEEYATLPDQVRNVSKWKLYVKFCFFSGLPITEGEMHYKVQDDIAEQVYGEEIILSHEVMEAVNGDSAEILTLPNTKTMLYLRKHYAQQCIKLDDRVFDRGNWERVEPKV